MKETEHKILGTKHVGNKELENIFTGLKFARKKNYWYVQKLSQHNIYVKCQYRHSQKFDVKRDPQKPLCIKDIYSKGHVSFRNAWY